MLAPERYGRATAFGHQCKSDTYLYLVQSSRLLRSRDSFDSILPSNTLIFAVETNQTPHPFRRSAPPSPVCHSRKNRAPRASQGTSTQRAPLFDPINGRLLWSVKHSILSSHCGGRSALAAQAQVRATYSKFLGQAELRKCCLLKRHTLVALPNLGKHIMVREQKLLHL